MRYSITITELHNKELREHLIKSDGFERPAILLCGRALITNDPWDGGMEERFLSKHVIPVPVSEIFTQSATEVHWATDTFRKALKIAEDENLAVCLVHSHPNHALRFSEVDNENEPSLIQTIFNRNGGNRAHASLVITPDGEIFGRAWSANLKSYPFYMIRVLGQRFAFHYPDKYSILSKEEFHRQQLAFGKTLSNDLSKLRIGVVGCGATGSATAHLLARIGVGQILLIDNDIVERTNLNRLHGATASDADAGRPKVDVLRDYISGIGIGARIQTIKDWVGSEACREAIKSCDIIFGCTDDNSGRIFLNRLAFFYLIPVIDMGIVIEPTDSDPPIIQVIQGRVTTIIPGNTCLLCRNEVSPQLAHEESLKRTNPALYERRKDEAYVIGAGNPSPAVITFTTEVSTMSVNELINRITGFRKMGAENNIVRFFERGEDVRPGSEKRPDCPICVLQKYWGKGDISPFMNQSY